MAMLSLMDAPRTMLNLTEAVLRLCEQPLDEMQPMEIHRRELMACGRLPRVVLHPKGVTKREAKSTHH